MPRALRWSLGGVKFLMSEVSLYRRFLLIMHVQDIHEIPSKREKEDVGLGI